MVIKHFIEHIKSKEKSVRTNYGISIDIINYDGWEDCPDCEYDTIYKRSKNPNCVRCSGMGKVPIVSIYTENVLPFWITEEDVSNDETGLLKLGDVKLKARSEAEPYFRNAMENKITLSIDNKDMLVKKIYPTITDTSIYVICSRSKKE
jgi:hypothetical protein